MRTRERDDLFRSLSSKDLLNKFLILYKSDDLLKHLEMTMRVAQGEHHDELYITAFVRVVHATPVHRIAKNAHANGALDRMLGLRVRDCDVVSTKLESRGVLLFARKERGSKGILDVTVIQKNPGKLRLDISRSLGIINKSNERFIELGCCHPYHLTLFSKDLTCSASLSAFIAMMSDFSKMPEPIPA